MPTRNHSALKLAGGVYSLTTTLVGWKHVFIKKEYLDFIIESIRFFQDKRNVSTAGYCIMPSHVHWIFKLAEDSDDIAMVLRTMKSFTATQLLKKIGLEAQDKPLPIHSIFSAHRKVRIEMPRALLEYFTTAAQQKQDTDQVHRFWQRNSDIKHIVSGRFLKQKLNYIHNNPVRKKWRLVEDPVDYPYSSCRYYMKGSDWNGLRIQPLY